MRAEPLPPRADTSNRDSRGVSNVLAVHFGPVVYADYVDTSTVGTGAMGPRSAYFLKRKSLEHEREFPALLWALAVDADGHVDLNVPVFPDGGVAVPVNLDVLIEAIHVSPGAPQWFREAVEASVPSALAKTGPLLLSRNDPASDHALRSRSEIRIG